MQTITFNDTNLSALVFDDDGQIIKADSPLKKGANINIHFSDRIANTTVNKVEKK